MTGGSTREGRSLSVPPPGGKAGPVVAPPHRLYTRAQPERAVPPGVGYGPRHARPPRPGEEDPLPAPDRQPRPSALLRNAALLAGAALLLPGLAGAQERTPRTEDAELPAGGEVRFRFAPVFQAWHTEFGPGPGGSEEVPLLEDWDGPLLEQVYPGPAGLLDDLNRGADSLGFDPLDPAAVSAGELRMRELDEEVRSIPFRVEVGILDRLAVDVMIPLVKTEAEPFVSLDVAGADLAAASAAFETPDLFFGQVADARTLLEARIAGGVLTPEEEQQATELLATSGAFAEALRSRVIGNDLVPAAGSAAGGQMAAHYASLVSGFSAFDLDLPAFSLPEPTASGLLPALGLPSLETANRGLLFGEPELGLRLQLLDGFARLPEERGGLEARTTVGVRMRFDVRDANSTVFIDPEDQLGLPLGDGQRDIELSVYQDLRVASTLLLNVVARYGIQQADELTRRVRSPERPLAPASLEARVERDLGDYRRLRVAPRLLLNPVISVGLEYRYWHKGRDRYTALSEGVDATPLETQTEQTLHRFGFGAFYRPDPPDEGERAGAVPELGFLYQRAVAGSGGETPAAGLVAFHVRVPFRVF